MGRSTDVVGAVATVATFVLPELVQRLFAIPAGVELTLEQDDAGALWYRAGGLRLGPVRFG